MLLFVLLGLAFIGNHASADDFNPLTSHVLDISTGLPGTNVKVVLYKQEASDTWKKINEKVTDEKGRVGSLITEADWAEGVYKLWFDTKGYFQSQNLTTFYPFVDIVFEVDKTGLHYHVPIAVSAYGYSTYRGS